ncbi:trpE operon leader peptide TrpLE [Sinorhizobium fredii]
MRRRLRRRRREGRLFSLRRERSAPVSFSRLRETTSHANTSTMANTQNISIWWWAR